MKQILPGKPEPLGAEFDGTGVNFAIFSEVASGVDLCLFDATGSEERLPLPTVDGRVWHGYVPGVVPGQRYGFRVHGPYDPGAGLRCNAHKVLLDPYARAIEGRLSWNPAVFAYRDGNPNGALNDDDNAAFVPKALVVDSMFDWGDDAPLRRPWHETVLYEAHVKGLTARHPDLPPELRGTFAGLAEPRVIAYLIALGVTALELLPVFQFESEYFLHQRGLSNYWGYNTLGFFAPHNGYSSSGAAGAIVEFKRMVKALHRAGIEVILDVVYNHTGESDLAGPTLAFRGIDNRAYYRHDAHDRGRYVDYTGCGNTFNVQHPQVIRLILDSLRYWVSEMHVDGFRFDLASCLARGTHRVNLRGKFMTAVHQDPVLRQVKLIAEPWDLGEGGYQVGQYPPPWSEWNGKFRDGVRDFWRGHGDTPGELMARFAGSPDLYAGNGHRPRASINFITSHDGFTLRDLVSYNDKHNFKNGEDNRDGESYNRSWNSGAEGPSTDPAVSTLRARRQRGLLATLLLSQGVPMLSSGDEVGRSQDGNNNPYCQDNELSWFDWSDWDEDLLQFVRRLLALRRDEPVWRQSEFNGTRDHGLRWFTSDGGEVDPSRWHGAVPLVLACLLDAQACADASPSGSSFFVAFNATAEAASFVIPAFLGESSWIAELDTAGPSEPGVIPGARFALPGYSLRVLRRSA